MSRKTSQNSHQKKGPTEPKKGSKLAELREDAGFTQVELAALLGVSLTTIQSWEKSGLPNLQKYYKLAHILGCELEELEDPGEEDSNRKLKEISALILSNKHSGT